MNKQERIQEFFQNYEEQFRRGISGQLVDTAKTRAAFADCFVSATPQGVTCGKNDEEFAEQIPRGYAFYRSIGTERMEVKNIAITTLDELHVIAHVLWSSFYRKKNQGSLEQIDFTVHYFLQLRDNTPKIFGFVTGDEQEVLKEHGLLPNN